MSNIVIIGSGPAGCPPRCTLPVRGWTPPSSLGAGCA